MATKITKITDREYTVNGKVVYQDSNNNWVSRLQLSTLESETFHNHLNNEII